jgi:hypothetical protein
MHAWEAPEHATIHMDGCRMVDGGCHGHRGERFEKITVNLGPVDRAGRVLGLATIAADVTPDLGLDTLSAVEVLGAFRDVVEAALAPRTV